jgi:hypothetical protein
MMIKDFNQKVPLKIIRNRLGKIQYSLFTLFTTILILILSLNITGCSGGDVPPTTNSTTITTSGTSSGTTTIIQPLTVDLIDTTTDVSTTTITKNDPGKIVIYVRNADGTPKVNEIVTVTTTKGSLYPADGLALTDSTGEAEIGLTATDAIGVGQITVAVEGEGTETLNFEILADTGSSATTAQIDFTFDLFDSASSALTNTITKQNPGKIIVDAIDANDAPLTRAIVSVVTTKGALYPADGQALTDGSGRAVIMITDNDQLGVGQITVTVASKEKGPLNFEILADESSTGSSSSSSTVTFDLFGPDSNGLFTIDSQSTTTISSELAGEIRVNVSKNDLTGAPYPRKIVTVTTTKGSLYPADGMALTDSAGQAVIAISANNEIGVGQITVTVDGKAEAPLNFEIVSAKNVLPNLLILTTSKTSVRSDDSDSATLTATVIKDNVPLDDVTVNFSSDGGLISHDSKITASGGKAEINFTSGPNAQNEVITITASVPGISGSTLVQISDSAPVQITGNDITLTSDQSNIGTEVDANVAISLTNAVPLGIANKDITITLEETPDTPGTPVVELQTPIPLTTDYNGAAQLVVKGKNPGTAIINAMAMGATGYFEIVVTAPEDVFEITAPTSTVVEKGMSTNATIDVVVNVPLNTDGTPSVSNVNFHTTLGCFDNGGPGCGGPGATSKSVAVVAGSGTASATATLGSSEAGTANITVSDAVNFDTYDNMQINFYAPPEEATQISLLASQTVVAPSPGDTKNSITLTATVTNDFDQVVGNAIVNFTISDNPIGGGEKINPGSVRTNSSGIASTTFYSGSLSSDSNGITITATIDSDTASDSVIIIIGGEAGSIVFGRSNKILASSDNTYYTQDISAHVTDANGNPVANETVSLNIWPNYFYLGYGSKDAQKELESEYCYFNLDWPQCSGIFAQSNEDANMNLVLDPGEDTGPYDLNAEAWQPDGQLTPHNSAAGSIPATVITDENGIASFKHTFLKKYALWVQIKMKASVMVLGTETQATSTWRLDALKSELAACDLFDSPFGYYVPYLKVSAGDDQPLAVVNTEVQLDGLTDPVSCAQTWAWSFEKVPTGSTVTDDSLSDPTIANPTFTPDLAGDYVLTLSVSYSGILLKDSVQITAN